MAAPRPPAPPLTPPAASSARTAAGTATGASASPTPPGLAARRWRRRVRAAGGGAGRGRCACTAPRAAGRAHGGWLGQCTLAEPRRSTSARLQSPAELPVHTCRSPPHHASLAAAAAGEGMASSLTPGPRSLFVPSRNRLCCCRRGRGQQRRGRRRRRLPAGQAARRRRLGRVVPVLPGQGECWWLGGLGRRNWASANGGEGAVRMAVALVQGSWGEFRQVEARRWSGGRAVAGRPAKRCLWWAGRQRRPTEHRTPVHVLPTRLQVYSQLEGELQDCS